MAGPFGSLFGGKGRRVVFHCAACDATEAHFERNLDIRAVFNPKCCCGGAQTLKVEGADTTGDIKTFGRSPAEAGSLVVCVCGNRGIIPGECDIVVISGTGQQKVHQRPVSCPRCGVFYSMSRPSSAPPASEHPDGACACGVSPVPFRRGMVLRCPKCQQRAARIVLMS